MRGALGGISYLPVVASVCISYLRGVAFAFSRNDQPMRMDHTRDATRHRCDLSRYISLGFCLMLHTAQGCTLIGRANEAPQGTWHVVGRMHSKTA